MSPILNASVLTRLFSALVLAPPLLFLVLAGTPFQLFLLSIPTAALLVYEWQRLFEPFSWQRFLPLLFAVSLLLWAHRPDHGGVPISLLCSFLLLFFFTEGLLRFRPNGSIVEDVGKRFFGVFYCALPLALLVEIRGFEKGGELICFLLLTIWATDIGAFFMGRRWGKRKLAPLISPGKTYAGFWGGILSATLTGGSVALVVSLPFGWVEGFLFGGILSIVGQVGDLAESLLKREAGVKDAGQWIPGHGGFLDRLDSLLFAIPAFYLLLWTRLFFTLKEW